MLRVVFDTNVFVSAALALKSGRTGSGPSRCIQLVLHGRAHLFVSPILLDELLEVLRRPKIGLTRQGAADYAHTVARIATVLPIAGKLNILQRDPDDNHLLQLVVACRAEYLVTGNLKHFEELPRDASGAPVYEDTRILRPIDFLSQAE